MQATVRCSVRHTQATALCSVRPIDFISAAMRTSALRTRAKRHTTRRRARGRPHMYCRAQTQEPCAPAACMRAPYTAEHKRMASWALLGASGAHHTRRQTRAQEPCALPSMRTGDTRRQARMLPSARNVMRTASSRAATPLRRVAFRHLP